VPWEAQGLSRAQVDFVLSAWLKQAEAGGGHALGGGGEREEAAAAAVISSSMRWGEEEEEAAQGERERARESERVALSSSEVPNDSAPSSVDVVVDERERASAVDERERASAVVDERTTRSSMSSEGHMREHSEVQLVRPSTAKRQLDELLRTSVHVQHLHVSLEASEAGWGGDTSAAGAAGGEGAGQGIGMAAGALKASGSMKDASASASAKSQLDALLAGDAVVA
jgi:hypothetical protein